MAIDISLSLTGKCPVSPVLEGGVKGHNIKGKYLTGKPRPLGRGASLNSNHMNLGHHHVCFSPGNPKNIWKRIGDGDHYLRSCGLPLSSTLSHQLHSFSISK